MSGFLKRSMPIWADAVEATQQANREHSKAKTTTLHGVLLEDGTSQFRHRAGPGAKIMSFSYQFRGAEATLRLRKTKAVARKELLVGERFDRIKTRGAQCGNRGTQGSPEQSQKNGAEDPTRREEDGEAGIRLLEDGLGNEGDGDAGRDSRRW